MAVRKRRLAGALPALIASEADIAACVAHLTARCPYMARAFEVAGHPPLRRWTDGYAGLVRVVVGQQLSIASANAIHGRLVAAVDPLEPLRLLATPDAVLRAAGLSAGKVATLRALSAAVVDGRLAFDRLIATPEDDVREALTSVRGIGPWTADIYLMFCRGDADAFAPGDLALQVGVQRLFGLEERPSPAELAAIAETWRPARAVAARLLWAYYGASAKSSAGGGAAGKSPV